MINLRITVVDGNTSHDYITRLGQPLTTLQVEDAFEQAKQWFYQVADTEEGGGHDAA